MKDIIFTGSGVAIVTPFTPDNKVDYDRLAELIEYQIDNRTDAIIICGTTGESSTLSDDEHRKCIACAVKVAAGRVPVIAGTGSNDTEYSLWLSRQAQEDGADALLQVTPYYNKTSQQGLVRHFGHIAEGVDIPIILYNVPSRTGVNISVETYRELQEYKNIAAVKEASGDISHIAEVAAECKQLAIYSGNDNQIVPIMSLGGLGVISVAANIVPRETHDICELYLSGRVKESNELFLKMLRLYNDLFIDVNPIPVKAAMNMMGQPVGDVRLPLVQMTDKKTDDLRKTLSGYGLI